MQTSPAQRICPGSQRSRRHPKPPSSAPCAKLSWTYSRFFAYAARPADFLSPSASEGDDAVQHSRGQRLRRGDASLRHSPRIRVEEHDAMRTELISIETDTLPLDGAFHRPDGEATAGAVLLFHGNTMNFYVGAPRFLPP